MSAFSSAFAQRFVALGFAVPTPARFLTSMMDCVHGRPGSTFGLIFRDALFSIAFLDGLGLSLLFVRVFVFVSSGHRVSPFWISKGAICMPVLIWPGNCQTKRESRSSARLSIKFGTKDIQG